MLPKSVLNTAQNALPSQGINKLNGTPQDIVSLYGDSYGDLWIGLSPSPLRFPSHARLSCRTTPVNGG